MLTEHKLLEGKLPVAWLEAAFRRTEDPDANYLDGNEFEETRFQIVCDERTGPLAAVSGRYALVQMREMIAALDLAAEEHGVTLDPTSATYRNGRGVYDFRCPDLEFRVPGDASATYGTISLSNDYRGAGNLTGMSGWFRWLCTNGLYVGTMASQHKRRHVGNIDVYAIVGDLVAGLRDRFEVERVLAETLAKRPYFEPILPSVAEAKRTVADSPVPTLVDSIMADTAVRYEKYLHTAIRENQREMGNNLWALTQAVAETSTHRMPGFAADEWATRQLTRIREFAR